MLNQVLIAFFAPLISFFIAGAFAIFARKKYTFVGVLASMLIILGTIASALLLRHVCQNGDIVVFLHEFIYAGNLNIDYELTIDRLSTTMMVTVGIVASVVHVYSIGYMEHDANFNKFFSFLGLFVFSMLFLVMSDNFMGLFIGWEGVGLCSWLLIGFWYDQPRVSWCANEAFIMNRVADLGMLLGMFLIYRTTGTLKFSEVFAAAPYLPHTILLLICVCLFIGAMGKSAQFPFHTWLADAMAGPTPVSALIHAATMVTAGVYLVVRASPLFGAMPEMSAFIAGLGTFVAVFAASMALCASDLKRIIAYSTLSQLGYMFVAAGLGAYWIAMFHLVTHAFFKSLLFLCAGNVMHAMHDDLNIHHMGGLRKYMKPTLVFMTIGSLALAGIYPFAGFFSKDKILETAFAGGDYIIWLALLIGAVFTAFYSFRVIMLVFFGEPKYTHHPHEAKNFMLIALLPLVILSVIAGFISSKFSEFMSAALNSVHHHLAHGTELMLIFGTLAVVIASIAFAIWAYRGHFFKENAQEHPLHKLLANNYYIPQLYDRIFVRPYFKISEICAALDMKIIDRSVDLVASLVMLAGKRPNKMQNSNLSSMIKWFGIGFLVILAILCYKEI